MSRETDGVGCPTIQVILTQFLRRYALIRVQVSAHLLDELIRVDRFALIQDFEMNMG